MVRELMRSSSSTFGRRDMIHSFPSSSALCRARWTLVKIRRDYNICQFLP